MGQQSKTTLLRLSGSPLPHVQQFDQFPEDFWGLPTVSIFTTITLDWQDNSVGVFVLCCVILFATQAWPPGFDPLNPCKGGRRGPLPKAVLSFTHMLCLSLSHRNTHTNFKNKAHIISYVLLGGIFILCLYPPHCENDLCSSFRVHPTQPHREIVHYWAMSVSVADLHGCQFWPRFLTWLGISLLI